MDAKLLRLLSGTNEAVGSNVYGKFWSYDSYVTIFDEISTANTQIDERRGGSKTGVCVTNTT